LLRKKEEGLNHSKQGNIAIENSAAICIITKLQPIV